jgi:pimeloyl-ACP methyl ester carboxylesterase
MERMILFPGLGADPRLYEVQRRDLQGVETPAWIDPRPRESIGEYAGRWGEMLQLGDRPAVLGGVSFGGMVALEMARRYGAKGVVLIGSCQTPWSVSRVLKACEWVSRGTPEIALDKGRVLAPLFLGRGGVIPLEHRDALVRMARELPVSFLRWAARAIVEWDGCTQAELGPGVPIHHIHGDRDWVMPLSRVQPTEVVKGGAHVLNMSHPKEVNAMLARVSGRAER